MGLSHWAEGRHLLPLPRSRPLPGAPGPLPRSGSMRNGQLFEPPTSAPPIGGSASSSSLLPTPVADNSRGLPPGRGSTYQHLAGALLPTPRASDGPHGGPNQRNSRGVRDALPGLIPHLLPTPKARDSKDAALGIDNRNRPDDDDSMPRAVRVHGLGDAFGPYGDAVERWEALTRPAPPPTEPSARDGRPRLSPRFVEWMMGLPEGWVTDVPGVALTNALRILGNGVVPQQARHAVEVLLARIAP